MGEVLTMDHEPRKLKPWSRITIEDLVRQELHNLDMQALVVNKLFNEPKDDDNENNQTKPTDK